jgi:hypothetical protein
MFGLERNTEEVDFSYDLEKDLANPESTKQIREDVDARIKEIKDVMRKGKKEKDIFNTYGILLHGYVSMKKVMERCLATN